MNTNRDIKRYWTPENTTEEKQTRGVVLNTDEVLFNVDDLEDRISEIENFLRTAFDGSVLKEAFGGTDNSQWVDFLEDLSVRLDNAVLTQNNDNSYLFVGNTDNSGKFNFSSLWNWIVTKLSSVFGLVKNNETGKVTLSADITGDITGNVTGDVTGNADTATLANRAEKVDISTSISNANFLLASIDNDAIVNGETPKRTSLKFNETTKELSSGDKVFASLEDVNSITAKYITSSVDGAAFADEAALQGTLYYAGQVISTQTTPALGENDYCIVLDSGFYHDHSTARYVYQNGVWTFQYKVSQITLTQAQLDALNSGITSSKVNDYDAYSTNKLGVANNLSDLQSASIAIENLCSAPAIDNSLITDNANVMISNTASSLSNRTGHTTLLDIFNNWLKSKLQSWLGITVNESGGSITSRSFDGSAKTANSILTVGSSPYQVPVSTTSGSFEETFNMTNNRKFLAAYVTVENLAGGRFDYTLTITTNYFDNAGTVKVKCDYTFSYGGALPFITIKAICYNPNA